MDINNEASVFKADIAKNLKKVSDKIVVGKNLEDNSTDITIEDKSKHLHLHFHYPVPLNDVEALVDRAIIMLNGQVKVIQNTSDQTFLPQMVAGLTPSMIASGTAGTLFVVNSDYLMEGKPEVKFITNFQNLPSSVNVVSPKKSK